MRFTEIDVFGVYVAPMSLMMVAAWLVTIALRGEHGPASHAKHHAHIPGDGFQCGFSHFGRVLRRHFVGLGERTVDIVKRWAAHHV